MQFALAYDTRLLSNELKTPTPRAIPQSALPQRFTTTMTQSESRVHMAELYFSSSWVRSIVKPA
jgi:hypothetical protein